MKKLVKARKLATPVETLRVLSQDELTAVQGASRFNSCTLQLGANNGGQNG